MFVMAATSITASLRLSLHKQTWLTAAAQMATLADTEGKSNQSPDNQRCASKGGSCEKDLRGDLLQINPTGHAQKKKATKAKQLANHLLGSQKTLWIQRFPKVLFSYKDTFKFIVFDVEWDFWSEVFPSIQFCWSQREEKKEKSQKDHLSW